MTNKPFIPPYQNGRSSNNNRALEMRRDNDTVRVLKRTLYDVDYAILYHLNNSIGLTVQENGTSVKVPVLYANGEKWAQMRKHGYLRDQTNKVIVPLITINRTGFNADDRFRILDLNKYVPTYKLYPYVNNNMQYDREDDITDKSYEFYYVDVPAYVKVQYDLNIWASSIEQLNDIIQTVFATNGHLWGDFFKYRCVIDQFTNEVVNEAQAERLVRATATVEADAILREQFEYNESTMLKAYTLKRVVTLNEREQDDPYLTPPADRLSQRHASEFTSNELGKLKHRDLRQL